MSATTSDDVERLTKLVLHSPITLNLLGRGGGGTGGGGGGASDAGGAAAEITHRRVDLPRACGSGGAATEAAEKLLHLLVLLKFGLVQRNVGREGRGGQQGGEGGRRREGRQR